MAEGESLPTFHRNRLSLDHQRQHQIEHPLSRTSSLPLGIDEIGTPSPSAPSLTSLSKPSTPIQDENVIPVRSSRIGFQNKAQQWRTSLAVTNSDYYSQWRPQISSLAMLHGSTIVRNVPNAPSLDIISEDEDGNNGPGGTEDTEDFQVADQNMFRYTPSRLIEGLPSSRSSTPQVVYATPSNVQGPSVLRESPRRHSVSSTSGPSNYQQDNRSLYVLKNGCYIPLYSLKETDRVASRAEQPAIPSLPPIHTRRRVATATPPHDLFNVILVTMILILLCLDVPVVLLFLLPSLACSQQVKKKIRRGDDEKAQKCSEWSRCFCITAIMFHIVFALLIVLTFLLLRFIGNFFIIA